MREIASGPRLRLKCENFTGRNLECEFSRPTFDRVAYDCIENLLFEL